jgi:hypothetical protein
MTLAEQIVTAIAGGFGTAVATYVATMRKVNSTVGAAVGAAKPGDDSLRDMVLRVEGKIDAQHEEVTGKIDVVAKRLTLVEHRVFTPPNFHALRAARTAAEKP